MTNFVGSTSNYVWGSSITLNVPTNTQDGDEMVAFLSHNDEDPDSDGVRDAATAPSGWTLEQEIEAGTTDQWVYCFKRTANSEPTDYTWNWTDATHWIHGTIQTFRSVDPLIIDNVTGQGDVTSVDVGQVTLNGDDIFLCMGYHWDETGTFNPNTNLTTIEEFTGDQTRGPKSAYRIPSSDMTTNSRTYDATNTGKMAAMSGSLSKASEAGVIYAQGSVTGAGTTNADAQVIGGVGSAASAAGTFSASGSILGGVGSAATGNGTLTGNAGCIGGVGGVMTASGTLSGTAATGTDVKVQGSLSSNGQLNGDFVRGRDYSGSADTITVLSGYPARIKKVTGDYSSNGSISGSVVRLRDAARDLGTTTTFTGTIIMRASVTGSVVTAGDISGDLYVSHPVRNNTKLIAIHNIGDDYTVIVNAREAMQGVINHVDDLDGEIIDN